jgi:hypothetical protein
VKKIVIALAIIAVVLAAVSVVKDVVIKTAVESGVEMVTGLKLRISSLRVGMLGTLIDIGGLKILNPAGFKDPTMLDMPKIFVDYDLPAILGGKVHLTDVNIDLKEFVVVKNSDGRLNLDSLNVVKAQKSGGSPAQTSKGKAPQIKIDNLELKIGKVVYKDYSAGASPSVKEFSINLNEKYSDITDPYSLVSIIVVKALMNTTIAGLANFDLSGLKGSIGPALAGAQKAASEAVVKASQSVAQAQKQAAAAQEQAKLAATRAQAAAKDAQEQVSKTADALKDVFKNPFASKDE